MIMKRMQRIVFNRKLNREKFINNREKFINNKTMIMSKANMMVKRQIHTNFMNGPPENDWLLIAFCVTIGYSILSR